MTFRITRCQPRCLPEKDGLQNVVTEIVIGMTGVDEVLGLSGYRDTLVKLPAVDPNNFTPFEDIDEAWVKPICEGVAKDNNWEQSIMNEIAAAKDRPVEKTFSFQQKQQPEPTE